MAICQVLSVGIGNEFPDTIYVEAHIIALPGNVLPLLEYSKGYPALPNSDLDENINDQIEHATAFARTSFSMNAGILRVDIIRSLAVREGFRYDPNLLCKKHPELDIAIAYTIEQLRKVFTCTFVFVHKTKSC